ncbi:MAG: hypothetical protein EZS28_038316 [Streblomastix strix]|uniref:Uncharacterized protein n=1 Tax=Streblomastix strix TaxID=222440 RepID=A0A5J4U6D6_9EUKA|nr:MAG: hypothetical protein EZS28_038316 [Streblomastix strix]
MILLTETMNQGKDQDQEAIPGLKNTKVQERLQIKALMDLRPEMNKEVEVEERIEEGDMYREAQKYNPYTKQAFSKTKNPINWNRTHQYEDKDRGEGWDDNINDDWVKRTQMQKDPPDNHNDRDSSWTEDEAPQHHSTQPQPKQPIQQTQRVQQIQIQPKQQVPVLMQRKIGRKDQPPNKDDIDELEIIQERIAKLQMEKEDLNIPDSDSDWQQLVGAIDNNNNLSPRSAQKEFQKIVEKEIAKENQQQQQTAGLKSQQRIISPLPRMISTGMNIDKPVIQSQLSVTPTHKPQHRSGIKQRIKRAERELELLQAEQQLWQQGNIDLSNENVDSPDIQGTVGQLTGLQSNPSAEGPGLNAGPRQLEAGSISANNRERTEPQINEGHDDNADEEEDEQTDEAALNQNKDYRVNIITQPPAQENLGTQSQNVQGSNAQSQMEKDDAVPATIGVQEKRKKG